MVNMVVYGIFVDSVAPDLNCCAIWTKVKRARQKSSERESPWYILWLMLILYFNITICVVKYVEWHPRKHPGLNKSNNLGLNFKDL